MSNQYDHAWTGAQDEGTNTAANWSIYDYTLFIYGESSPAVEGDWSPYDAYDGHVCYTQGETYFLWWDSASSNWVINTSVGNRGDDCFACGTLTGTYTACGSYEGEPTVDFHDTLAWQPRGFVVPWGSYPVESGECTLVHFGVEESSGPTVVRSPSGFYADTNVYLPISVQFGSATYELSGNLYLSPNGSYGWYPSSLGLSGSLSGSTEIEIPLVPEYTTINVSSLDDLRFDCWDVGGATGTVEKISGWDWVSPNTVYLERATITAVPDGWTLPAGKTLVLYIGYGDLTWDQGGYDPIVVAGTLQVWDDSSYYSGVFSLRGDIVLSGDGVLDLSASQAGYDMHEIEWIVYREPGGSGGPPGMLVV